MAPEHIRDSAMSALILGFFASAWFGWAQERPPDTWRIPLIVGSVVSVFIAITGGLLAWQHWSDSSALHDSGAMTRFIVIFWVEFVFSAIGAGLLAWSGKSAYMAVWICLVVGVHFLPLAPLFKDPWFVVLGIALILVAVIAILVVRRTSIAPSAITGVGAGVTLLVFAIGNAIRTVA